VAGEVHEATGSNRCRRGWRIPRLLGAGRSAGPTAFVGLYYAYQGLILDVATGALVLTNGTDHFIHS